MEIEDLSREDLIRHIAGLNAELIDLQARLHGTRGEADWISGSLKARTRLLNERIKELNCVYQMVQIMRSSDLRFEQKVEQVIALLPKAWQFPDAAYARAVIGERDFRSPRFSASQWLQSEPITANGSRVGTLEVGYLRPLPACDEGPFLREERALLKVVAECLGGGCELEAVKSRR